jgi:hypothetical protein
MTKVQVSGAREQFYDSWSGQERVPVCSIQAMTVLPRPGWVLSW